MELSSLVFLVTGLLLDIFGAYLIVRSLIKLNPQTTPLVDLLKIGWESTHNFPFRLIINVPKLEKKVRELIKSSKEKPDYDEEKLIVRQVKDAFSGFLILVSGFVLQIIGNVNQYLCAHEEFRLITTQWCTM